MDSNDKIHKLLSDRLNDLIAVRDSEREKLPHSKQAENIEKITKTMQLIDSLIEGFSEGRIKADPGIEVDG